jgi:hypothetical protein
MISFFVLVVLLLKHLKKKGIQESGKIKKDQFQSSIQIYSKLLKKLLGLIRKKKKKRKSTSKRYCHTFAGKNLMIYKRPFLGRNKIKLIIYKSKSALIQGYIF